MSFTLEHIHRTINNLGRLMPAKPNKDSTREYSLKEAIFLMAPQLLETLVGLAVVNSFNRLPVEHAGELLDRDPICHMVLSFLPESSNPKVPYQYQNGNI